MSEQRTIEMRAYGVAFPYRKQVDEVELRNAITEAFADVVETDPRVIALVEALAALWKRCDALEMPVLLVEKVYAALKPFEK